MFLVLSRIILADSRAFLRFSRGSLSNDRKWKNSCIKMDSFKKNFKIFATYFTTGRIILTRKRSSHSCKHFSSSWLDCWKWPPLLDDLFQVEIIEIIEIFYWKKFLKFSVRKWRIGNNGLKMRNGLDIKLNSYLIHG